MPRYIDADKLIKRANSDYGGVRDAVEFARFVNDEPTADVKPIVKGKWELASSYEMFGGDENCWSAHGNPIASIYCSNCGFEPYVGDVLAIPDEAIEIIVTEYNICPHCGAKMDEVVKENE